MSRGHRHLHGLLTHKNLEIINEHCFKTATRLLHPWDSPGENTGVGCHFLLEGIFPTQGSNPHLPHCRQMLYPPSHQGSPIYKEKQVCFKKALFKRYKEMKARGLPWWKSAWLPLVGNLPSNIVGMGSFHARGTRISHASDNWTHAPQSQSPHALEALGCNEGCCS